MPYQNSAINLTVFLTLVLLILVSKESYSQDPHMTQFYSVPTYTNPSMAGTGSCNGGGRVALNYRNQWPSLPGTFVTTTAGYDQHFDKIGGGVGILLMEDQAGEGLLTSRTVSGLFSYQIKAGHNFNIRFGLEGQFGQRSIDWYKLRFEDQLDIEKGFVLPSKENFNTDQVQFANFSTGMLGYSDNFYFGLAVHNLTEPNQSFLDGSAFIPRRYSLHTGVVIPLDYRRNPKSSISPNVLIMKQNEFSQMNIGFYYNRGSFVSGLWFRQTLGTYANPDALMALVGFQKDKFKFGYSYDFTISQAKSAVFGSHEISAAIEWCAKNPCPSF
ncbi:MAG: PorP/SprF family type IX secretion system membrane protein [Bacteroidia bacterium]